MADSVVSHAESRESIVRLPVALHAAGTQRCPPSPRRTSSLGSKRKIHVNSKNSRLQQIRCISVFKINVYVRPFVNFSKNASKIVLVLIRQSCLPLRLEEMKCGEDEQRRAKLILGISPEEPLQRGPAAPTAGARRGQSGRLGRGPQSRA